MSEKDKLYIGALLHDIGKFWQRTEWRRQFVPHAEQSADFLTEHFKDDTLLRDIARFHHAKALKTSSLTGTDRVLAEIVFEADNLASMERERDVENYVEKRLVNVFSLVGKRDADHNWHKTVEKTYQPLGRLTPAGDYYPMPTDEPAPNDQHVGEMWANFSEEFKKEVVNGPNPTTLYYLCKKYLWCQSSAYWKNAPEISLFEHSRLTAAIAVCLYDFLKERVSSQAIKPGNLDKPDENRGSGTVLDRTETRYLLVLADLSGIQNYIYNIAHDNALKALKGRSFYLQQLMDGVALQILHELDLHDAHLLFSGGGAFYLLLPNTEQAKKVLTDTERKVNEDILKTYHGVLSLNFAWDELSGNDFAPETIKNKWLDLKEKTLRRNKYRKMNGLVGTGDFYWDGELPFGGVKVCDATGTELVTIEELENINIDNIPGLSGSYNLRFKKITLANGHTIYQRPKNEDEHDDGQNVTIYEDKFISQEQFEAITIGQRLKREAIEIQFYIDKNSIRLPGGKVSFLPITRKEKVEAKRSEAAKTYKINDDEFLKDANGWRFYGGNWFPKKSQEDRVKPKDEETTADFGYLRDRAGVPLPGQANVRTGLQYLAVLRMDVDNLGDVFRNGLEKPPFSRIVQLSNMLDFFFSGYLNRLQNLRWDIQTGVNEHTGESLEECIQIIYAGGDDLCIVGKWHVMPDVACWIREHFAKFTGQNPAITISAGIALFGAKYPLFKVAERAGEAEDKAKGYRQQRKNQSNIEKDAICFLENPLGWDDFAEARRLTRDLFNWITNGKDHEGRTYKMPRSFLQMIQELFFQFSGNKPISELTPDDIEKRRYGRWRWQSAYRLSRMADRNKAYEKEIRDLATQAFLGTKTNKEYLFVLLTAAQWADFLTRENKTENTQ